MRHGLILVCAMLCVVAACGVPVLAHPDHTAHEPLARDTPATQPGTRDEPAAPTLSPVVQAIISDTRTPENQRRAMMIFHGLWDKVDSPTVAEQASIALQRFQLDDPSLSDESVPVLTRATAALWRGEPEQLLKMTENLDTAKDAAIAMLRARALWELNRTDDAVAAVAPWRIKLTESKINTATQLTAAADGLALVAELEGRPAQDFQLAISLLGQARGELDRLYWPAFISEARLLRGKDNAPEAAAAVMQALELNPRSGEAWYLAGQLAVTAYDFKNAGLALARLRGISRDHLLADILESHILLTQDDPDGARAVLDMALSRYPNQRTLLAMLAATEALALREPAMRQVLDRLEKLSPGSPEPYMIVGRFLSAARQYRRGEQMLREAILRRPRWPEPRVELGLLLMQSGDEEKAQAELRQAVALDTFHHRAANQLKLVDELLSYERIETEHFIIRFHKGIDRVLASDMPDELERIYDDITKAYGHRPKRKTLIEIMPDEQWFGVRITGMPWIWTIGACTGDVIAITPPRDGLKQRGTYDWARVLRHEFVHTVTLDQTDNRIPHWFTEACAVSQEPGGRDFQTYQLLASAYNENQLFELEDINWGFIRPRRPIDRPLAYAQSHWMIEYITAKYGHAAVKALLNLYREPISDSAALAKVTGRTPAQFMDEFKAWAGEQVKTWGLAPRDGDAVIKQLLPLSKKGDSKEVREWIEKHPDHTISLRLEAERLIRTGARAEARAAVARYAEACPVDPWSNRMLAQLAMQDGRTQELIGSLEALDNQEQQTGAWAYQLANLHRATGELDAAASSATRALHLEAYNATYRELAAGIELQRGEQEKALHHLEAMTYLEPDVAKHYVRVAALLMRMKREDEARAAATRAKELDPAAPVDAILNPPADK